jgi:hypothetical protein
VPRTLIYLLLLCISIVVSSCQMQTSGESPKPNSEALSNTSTAAENIGKGKVLVSMLLNRSGSLKTGNDAANYRDGAALAVKSLGIDYITLSIKNTQSVVASIAAAVSDELKNNTSMFIIEGEPQLIKNTLSFLNNKNIPVVSLGADSLGTKSKFYTFQPDGIDTLIAGLRFAAANGKKKLVVILSNTQPAADIRRIKKYAAGHADLIDTITYKKNENSKTFVQRHLKALSSANVIALAGKSNMMAGMAGSIGSLATTADAPMIIGRADWPADTWKKTTNNGVIIATPDSSSLKLVSGRFQKEYSRPMPLSAAYAFDVVAIAAGLARVKNTNTISRSSLEGKAGFRGATGIFRFKKDGSVERLYKMSQVRQGKLSTIQEIATGY